MIRSRPRRVASGVALDTAVRGTRVIRTAAMLAWAALVANVFRHWLPMDAHDLLIGAAVTLTLTWAILHASRPVVDVYLMGFDAGRRSEKTTQAAQRGGSTVLPFRRNGTEGPQ